MKKPTGKFILLYWLFILIYTAVSAQAVQSVTISSPDNNTRFDMNIRNGVFAYKINYKNEPVIDWSAIGVEVNDKLVT